MNFPSATILVLTLSLVTCSALLSTSPTSFSIPQKIASTSTGRHQPKYQDYKRIQLLYSSVNNDDDDDDDDDEDGPLSDELSKLIGKRASISSKKAPSKASSSSTKTTSSMGMPADNDENAIIDPSFESMYEGKTGLDIFEMPDFKNKRPLKDPMESKDKARGGDGSGSGETTTDDYFDFKADYEDENDFHIPNRMGVSTIAWGDVDQGFKAGKKLKKKAIKAGKFLAGDLQVAFDKLVEAGVIFFDTSETYGLQSSAKSLSAEHILGQCMDSNANAQSIVASSMATPLQSLKQGTGMRLGEAGVLKAIEGSSERLGSASIELYQVPTRMFYPGPPGVLTGALSNAMDSGLINNVGISTDSKSSMKRFNSKLDKKGDYQLTSNSFEFSLVNRKAWKSGLIDACKAQGIIPIARNPLGDGLASGIWTATNPTGGEVSKKQPFDFKTLDKYTTLHDVLANVQNKVKDRLEKQNKEMTKRRNRYGGAPMITDVTTMQIAINYVRAKGCVPVPTVKNPKDADEIIGCLSWDLTDDEVKLLDNAADMSDKGLIV